ncbi:MAG TPA: hypothetical protein PLI31_08310, partial [Methanoregulaceae archaeon]|nr:hypothetical protein [Methanoregulaceae archaeon]
MPPPSTDSVIDAMLRILLVEERSLGLVITPEGVLIRLPTTRRIAERLDVPHYYVLPLIGALEADGDLTRAERVGIQTTPAGTRRLFARIETQYRAEAEVLIGRDLY